MAAARTPKRTPVRKLVLASPFTPAWPTVEDDKEQRLLKVFQALKDAWVSSGGCKAHTIVGLNAVTRALEKGQLSAVLLNVAADPPRLAHGVIQLCRATGTPVACVKYMAKFVDGVVAVSSVLALGVRKSDDCTLVGNFVHELTDGVPPLSCLAESVRRDDKPHEATWERTKSVKPQCPDVTEVYLPRKTRKVGKLSDYTTLVGENSLGFPSYEPPVGIVIRSETTDSASRTEEVQRTSKSSYVRSNVRQVYSRGKKRNKSVPSRTPK